MCEFDLILPFWIAFEIAYKVIIFEKKLRMLVYITFGPISLKAAAVMVEIHDLQKAKFWSGGINIELYIQKVPSAHIFIS